VPDNKVTLTINGIVHSFPVTPKQMSTNKSEKTDWFEISKSKYGISHQEASVLNVAIQNLENNWQT